MKRRNGKRKEWAGLIFLMPSLAGVSIFVVIPFADVIRRSFFTSLGGDFIGLDNYKEVLQNEAFQLAARNTLRFSLLCIPLLMLLSLILALCLSGAKAGYAPFCKTAYLAPFAVPAASIALIWKLFFHQNGLMNQLLAVAGVEGIDFMNSQGAFYVLAFSYLWKNAGYDMVLWTAGLSIIPESLYEAAKADGAGPWKRFIFITAPNLLPVVFTICVLSLLNSFKVFREAYLVAGEHPHTSMYLLEHLFNNWFTNLDIDKLCAGAVMMAAAACLLIFLLQKAWGGLEDE